MERRYAKPWYRARNIILVFFAIIAGLAGWAIFKSVTAVPGAPIDYSGQIQALALRQQPSNGADGYPIFMNIVEIVDKAHDRIKAEAGPAPDDLPRNNGWPIDYSAISEPEVHPLVYQASLQAIDYAVKAGLYDELDALTKAPRVAWPKPAEPIFEQLFPHLGKARNLARMGAARMDLAAARGDWGEFARAFEHTLGVSRVCDAQGFLISRLVSVAIDALALGRARKIIATADVSEAALVRMLAAIDASGTARPSIVNVMEAERLAMLDAIQNVFTDDGNGDGSLIVTKMRSMEGQSSSGPGSWKIINLAGLVLPGKKATIAKIDELFAGVKKYAETPPAARQALALQPDQWVEALPKKYAPIKLLAPSLGRMVQSQDQAQSTWNGTRVMLAIEIYKRRHGAYPQTLEALVPEILKELPKDPFGGVYRYVQMAPGQDPSGAGYSLYSVGADGKDDQGAAPATEGGAFGGSSPSGDYRFNAPK